MTVILRLILAASLLAISFSAVAQGIGINNTGTPPDASAIVDIESSTKGLLIPRLSTAQRTSISNPATGLLVFDTDKAKFYCYAGTWVEIMSDFLTLIEDTDGDTKIQAEENPDEDKLRFDLGGAEHFVMSGPHLEVKNSGNSVFIGEGAGVNDDLITNYNTYIGANSGFNNIGGTSNVGVGFEALYSDPGTSENVAVGRAAMRNIVNRSGLVAVGDSALVRSGFGASNASHGSFNTAVGNKALKENTTGHGNTAVGHGALRDNSTGFGNVAVGSNTLLINDDGYFNIAIGMEALRSNTGYSNVGIGDYALYQNDGNRNIAIGDQCMMLNILGETNIAVGHKALRYNSTGESNIVLGYESMFASQTGDRNVSIGNYALYSTINKSALVAIGDSALFSNGPFNAGSTQAVRNTAVGKAALLKNTLGSGNSAFGSDALRRNSVGNNNTAVGDQALSGNAIGSSNTAVGALACQSCFSASNNTALGYRALADATVAASNTAVGASALPNPTGDSNTGIGVYSLFGNTQGSGNVGIGNSTGYYNQEGSNNTFIGYWAGIGSGFGSKSGNVCIGYKAGQDDDGSNKLYIANSETSTPLIYGEFNNNKLRVHGKLSASMGLNDNDGDTRIQLEETNDEDKIRFDMAGAERFVMDGPHFIFKNSGSSVFIGENAGSQDDLSTNRNIFIGNSSGQTTTTGDWNIAIGNSSFENNVSGHRNIAIGHVALRDATGAYNVAVGVDAGQQNATGSVNVFLGFESGLTNTGSGNVFLGNQSGRNSGAVSNRLYIDNSSTATPLIYGDFSANYVQINGDLKVGNETFIDQGTYVTVDAHWNPSADDAYDLGGPSHRWQDVWSGNGVIQTSDLREKTDVHDLEYGLNEILALRPISYQWKNSPLPKRKLGLSAQQLLEVLPETVVDQVEQIAEDGSIETVQSERLGVYLADIIPVLVRGIQEQDAHICQLTQRVTELEAKLSTGASLSGSN